MNDRDEFVEHVKKQAKARWKWKNSILAAVLALIFWPFGLLYVSWKKALGAAVLLLVAAQIFRYIFGLWPPPVWVRYLTLVLLAVYAYTDTRWTNAAIEYYKHGLPGAGMQKPS